MPVKYKLNIALVQPDIAWENSRKNISHYNDLLQSLNEPADIIVFPEMFTTGFTMDVGNFSEDMKGNSIKWMLEKADEKGAAICGSLIIKDGNLIYNRFVFAEPGGKISYYDKRHLFSIGEEDKHFSPGTKRTIITYKGWNIAPFICYDLRFPVWCRNRNDYDLMIYVANWPSPRKDVWKTLLKARAIENQSYVIGVNRIGRDGMNINYSGNSVVVDPMGTFTVSPEIDNETIVRKSISKHLLSEFRKKFPVGHDADEFIITKS